ncbi:tyrosine kinase domain protein [Rhizoctonia solani 123E]|uniref:Tyrosine kinase domain protein n=1 Tax=Rhizoctonia solani 123E TaxID=1423351 RepID=A0A074SLA8_9AGAM|nr:tyrosine kinase domain protein [Rhizoctonia solani 123E]
MNYPDSNKLGPYQDANQTRPEEEPTSQSAASTHTRIDSSMSTDEMIDFLRSRGVRGITDQIDSSSATRFPTIVGGISEVYEARLTDGSRVAIKCPRIAGWGDDMHMQLLLERTARELYVWSKCAHPNLVPLIGMAQFRGQISLISPWMENGTISQYLSHTSASLTTRYRMCEMISAVTTHLHDRGIAHGNIKGSKILVSKDGTPMLGGFGNAGLREMSFQFSSVQSNTGFTMRWAAPELLIGECEMPTLYADIYALGMVSLGLSLQVNPYIDPLIVSNYCERKS